MSCHGLRGLQSELAIDSFSLFATKIESLPRDQSVTKHYCIQKQWLNHKAISVYKLYEYIRAHCWIAQAVAILVGLYQMRWKNINCVVILPNASYKQWIDVVSLFLSNLLCPEKKNEPNHQSKNCWTAHARGCWTTHQIIYSIFVQSILFFAGWEWLRVGTVPVRICRIWSNMLLHTFHTLSKFMLGK